MKVIIQDPVDRLASFLGWVMRGGEFAGVRAEQVMKGEPAAA